MSAPALPIDAPRLREWCERLDALLAERRQMPLKWGVNDCCLLAADAVRAVTGVDLASDLRGTYFTEAAALRTLRAHGGVERIAEDRLGPLREIAPRSAQAGDIGVVLGSLVGDPRPALGVCGGAHWHAVGEQNLLTLPIDRVLRAWRVGPCRP